jgi:excisionase family DNA binding protein
MPTKRSSYHVVGERQFLVALQRGHIWRHHVFDLCHFFRPRLRALADNFDCDVSSSLFLDCLQLKGVQMKDKPVAKTRHYAGPVRVITVREVSAYLRVHPSTIYRMLKNKKIPAFHVGGDWRFNVDTIDSWRLEQKLGGQRVAALRLEKFETPPRGGPWKSPNPNPTMDNHQPANSRVIRPRIAVKFASVVKQSRPELLIAAT